MTKNKTVATVNFLADMYLHHRNQDTAVGLNHDSVLTDAILRQATEMVRGEVTEIAALMQETAVLQTELTGKRLAQQRLTKQARQFHGRGRKRFVNEKLREVQALYDEALEIAGKIQANERRMMEITSGAPQKKKG